MKIALGTDHAGFNYKEAVKEHLQKLGHEVQDFGTFSEESVDYPTFVRPAAESVADGSCDLGVVFGGSGNGEAMAANKVKGVRCALCWSEETARLAKEHNNANVLSIGQRQISQELALNIIDTWLNADFEGDRHIRRIEMLDKNI
ncbi:ribose-5-phosphate isomerase [Opitutales bacterium]|uniref:ribose-5-phosphate isomerase n=1 Tax=Candidatus Chordibacter forsetii TaxID=3381758 RepID=UPI0023238929|nr:ribose-5-phosphate isomerase [Opitutales bacterium]MDA8989201.1 ribose-5-phosphate isomerase [Opitutales bacterium]